VFSKSQLKVNFEKKDPVLPISVSFTTKGYDNVTTPYYLFSLHYLSSGHLREVKKVGKFQTFSSKSGYSRFLRGDCLQEVPNVVICLGNFWVCWKTDF